MAIGKAKEVKASDKVKQAQLDKQQKIDALNSKIGALEIQSKEAAKRMGEAAESEDLSAYSQHKEEKRSADDAIELYKDKLDSLSKASLFGNDTNAMLVSIQREQIQITHDAMTKALPLLDQVYEIADKARAEYLATGNLISIVCEHTGIDATIGNPDVIVGLIRSIAYYVDPHTREIKGWK